MYLIYHVLNQNLILEGVKVTSLSMSREIYISGN